MPIERSSRVVAVATISTVARQLLDASGLCAIATVAQGDLAHVNTAYFAWDGRDFDLVWLSDPNSAHSLNLARNPTAAVAVYDSDQRWNGSGDRGIQLFGMAREVTGRDVLPAQALYRHRFPAYEPTALGGYRCYRFQPQRMKLFDENTLGVGVFVTAAVLSGGQLRFEHTEISHP
jgi:uncharacterized protein YhbP (UPF0306 family)